MAKIDVFDGSDFTAASLTAAINKLPFPPTRLGSMGIFSDTPIRTTVAHVEDKQGKLTLIPVAARGTSPNAYSRPQRTTRPFNVPHVPLVGALYADDIQNIRSFGSETELEAVGEAVTDVLQGMVNDIAITQEYHRIGAIQGSLKDADGVTEIVNLYTEFEVSEITVNFDFTANAMDAEVQCSEVHRQMGNALGATPYSGIAAVCGDNFFHSMAANADVRLAYDRWMDGEFLRQNKLGPDWGNMAAGFTYQNIYFFNYRGTIGDVTFMPTDEARFIPLGVPDLFQEVLAPPNTMAFANTRGQRMYVSQERMPHDAGIEFLGQGNVLAICNRPAACIKGAGANTVTPI